MPCNSQKVNLKSMKKELEQTVEKRTNEKMELEVEKYQNFEYIYSHLSISSKTVMPILPVIHNE